VLYSEACSSLNEDKATRYNRLKRRASAVSLLWSAALFVTLLLTGASLTLRSLAESVAGYFVSGAGPAAMWFTQTTVIVYVCLLTFVSEIGGAPLGLYAGFVLERRYGLSNEHLDAWLRDHVKALLVGLILGCAAAVVLYALIASSQEWWWLTAGFVFAMFVVGLTQVTPILLLPLFYRLRPLERDALRTRLLALAERAGARVLGAYEWGLSHKTKKANAALTGLGATRRILVSDTMLAEYTDDEIEVVLAHELAHHVHGDIWKGILLESVLILGGFYLAAQALEASAATLGLRNVADVAGLPLLVLAAGAVSFLTVPVAHAMSRAYERKADLFALDLTRNPDAFISAMRRLGAQNLAEDHPSKIIQWLFYSHPPVRERIEAAQAFADR
jgi:STE24 endopeptidase